jgi:hypothetical protein
MFDELIRALCARSRVKPSPSTAMGDDHLLHLLDSTFSFDTGSLLRDMYLVALLSTDYEATIRRFMVESIHLCKDDVNSINPQHEKLLVKLFDAEHRRSYTISLERSASDDVTSLDRPAFFKRIYKKLKGAPLASWGPSPASEPSDSEEYPLSPLSRLPGPPASTSELVPLLDSLSLKSVTTLHASMQSSTTKVYQAVDRFGGAKNLLQVPLGRTIRQIAPASPLPLFDLVILADTVHKYDPTYTTLEHQCFWFASIICSVILDLYGCRTLLRRSEGDVSIPPDSYLPDSAGRWYGFLVNRVKVADSAAVATAFDVYRGEKYSEVRRTLNFEW